MLLNQKCNDVVYFENNFQGSKMKYIFMLFLLSSFDSSARVKIKIEHGASLDGFAQIRVVNEMTRDLACYVAVDGYKMKFRLPALTPSIWYKVTDKRFDHNSMSTWCDFIALHPEYKNYYYLGKN